MKCTICQQEKPDSEFYLERKKNGKVCKRKQCRECKRVRMRKYRSENRDLTNQSANKSHNKARQENPIRTIFNVAKARAKKKGLVFDIQENDIVVPEFCPILGIKLSFNRGALNGQENSPSLDRVIPERGYVKGNICVISNKANTIKSFGTIDDHRRIVEYMKLNNLIATAK